MQISVKRQSGQPQELQKWLHENGTTRLAWVDKDGTVVGTNYPDIKVNDPASTVANGAAINAACGLGALVRLPKGKIFHTQVDLGDGQAGLTIAGVGGETVLCARSGGAGPYPISILSSAFGYVDGITYTVGQSQFTLADATQASKYTPGSVVYLFDAFGAFPPIRTPQVRRKVESVSGAVVTVDEAINTSNLDSAKWTRQGKVVSGAVTPPSNTVTLAEATGANAFEVGATAFLTDGAGAAEMVGEYVRVKSKSGAIIALDAPVRRSYRSGQTALIPAPSPGVPGFPENITIRDLAIGGPASTGRVASMQAKDCHRLTISNVDFRRGDPSQGIGPFGLVESTGVLVDNCRVGIGIGVGACSDVTFRNCHIVGDITDDQTAGVYLDEYTIATHFIDCRLSGHFQIQPGCDDTRLIGCICDWKQSTFVYIAGSCQIIGTTILSSNGPVRIDGANSVLAGVRAAGVDIQLEGGSTNCTIDGLICRNLILNAGTSGAIANVIVTGAITDNSGGGWRILGTDLVLQGVSQAFALPFTVGGVTPKAFLYHDSTFSALRIGGQGVTGPTNIVFETPAGASYTDAILLNATFFGPAPTKDNAIALGDSSRRWQSLTVGTGAATFGGALLANGSAPITSAPPAAANTVGWKIGLFTSAFAIGIAGYTLAVMADRWLSLFDDATLPANNATSDTPDTSAKVSFGTDGSGVFTGPVSLLGNVGFYGQPPQAKPTVTGSKGGNAALDSLLDALASLGLITDSTT